MGRGEWETCSPPNMAEESPLRHRRQWESYTLSSRWAGDVWGPWQLLPPCGTSSLFPHSCLPRVHQNFQLTHIHHSSRVLYGAISCSPSEFSLWRSQGIPRAGWGLKKLLLLREANYETCAEKQLDEGVVRWCWQCDRKQHRQSSESQQGPGWRVTGPCTELGGHQAAGRTRTLQWTVIRQGKKGTWSGVLFPALQSWLCVSHKLPFFHGPLTGEQGGNIICISCPDQYIFKASVLAKIRGSQVFLWREVSAV